MLEFLLKANDFGQVLDYGAIRDGIAPHNLGRRIVVDESGFETRIDDDYVEDEAADV